jgi:hypothetical protein
MLYKKEKNMTAQRSRYLGLWVILSSPLFTASPVLADKTIKMYQPPKPNIVAKSMLFSCGPRSKNASWRPVPIEVPAGAEKKMDSIVYGTSFTPGMISAIQGRATPPFDIVSLSNRELTPVTSGRADTRFIRYKVKSRLPSTQDTFHLPIAVMLPVSGHTGQADEFAKSNIYELRIKQAGGKVVNLPNIKSNGLVTEAGMVLPLKKGLNVLTFWPKGSLGVGGFEKGRTLEILVD